jgi:hypothetical protein
MALTLVTVTFGSQSTEAIEKEVEIIYRHLPPGDRAIMDFVEDKELNTPIAVDAGKTIHFFGPQALKFLRSYNEVAQAVAQSDYRQQPRQEMPEPEDPAIVNRLAKTRVAPGVQYSESAPTVGHHYKYAPPEYLPEENMGMYGRSVHYPLPSHHPIGRSGLHVDGRTRLPSHQ